MDRTLVVAAARVTPFDRICVIRSTIGSAHVVDNNSKRLSDQTRLPGLVRF